MSWSQFFSRVEDSVTRGHSWKLSRNHCRTDTRLHYTTLHVCQLVSMVSSKEDHVLPTCLVLDQGYGVDIIYLDYRKAFDSVDHAKLTQKLQNCNVDSKLIKWIAAFLQNRKMTVKVKLEFSDWVAVLSGVPQGLSLIHI